MDSHGQDAQVDSELVVPRVPPPRELGALQRLQFLARAQLVERALALDEQRAVFAQVRELEHDVGHPEARRPERDRAVVDAEGCEEGERSGDEVVRAEEGELLERVEDEHGPALGALDGVQPSRRRRGALECYEPLDDG